MAPEYHRCRYISPEGGLLAEPTIDPQDGSFIGRRQGKRELPESEVDSFEFDVPDSKRMRADPRVYLDTP